ncbi:baeRF7 domain-containing protein [Mesonia aquimarina]|uniref:baeRF7 domain-containing protein n=1 Tax=Mesonia aquimarina TaxID=1504967 RepID=UPI000EF6187F|nr:hypothetical protein [Mesonia aquimarina]
MTQFKTDDFNDLASYNSSLCISIFLPTHTKGKEVLEKENKTHLKSLWIEIKKDLDSEKISKEEYASMEAKISDLLEDPQFWRHQDAGLAIFITHDFFNYYQVPVHFKPDYYILNNFYLLPLIPLLSTQKEFYLLDLSLKDVAFYKASKQYIEAIEIEDLTPDRLEDRVGFDYKEKSLQARSLSSGNEETQFHGHGGSNRNENVEIKQFFSAVNEGLQTYINSTQEIPLVVACDNHLFPIYQEANTYTYLWEKPAPMSSTHKEKELLENALTVITPYLNEEVETALTQYTSLPPSNTSSAIQDILPAAHQGKIETFFITKGKEIWGNYDSMKQKVEISEHSVEEGNTNHIPLLNTAAIEVFNKGGKVFLVESWDIQEDNQPAHAIFRY